ncbi:MAG: hypothetical protein IPG87_11205 [Saprospiraceae bacterium]|nr:hypothetical protein [Candidatus Vicinibacter affinis]
MDNLQKYHKKSDDKIFSSHLIGDPNGFHAIISNYGAKLISLFVPDAHGQLADVVAGYDTIEEYLKGCPYYGAICGRYANRIAYGKFSLGMKNTNWIPTFHPICCTGAVRAFNPMYGRGQNKLKKSQR